MERIVQIAIKFIANYQKNILLTHYLEPHALYFVEFGKKPINSQLARKFYLEVWTNIDRLIIDRQIELDSRAIKNYASRLKRHYTKIGHYQTKFIELMKTMGTLGSVYYKEGFIPKEMGNRYFMRNPTSNKVYAKIKNGYNVYVDASEEASELEDEFEIFTAYKITSKIKGYEETYMTKTDLSFYSWSDITGYNFYERREAAYLLGWLPNVATITKDDEIIPTGESCLFRVKVTQTINGTQTYNKTGTIEMPADIKPGSLLEINNNSKLIINGKPVDSAVRALAYFISATFSAVKGMRLDLSQSVRIQVLYPIAPKRLYADMLRNIIEDGGIKIGLLANKGEGKSMFLAFVQEVLGPDVLIQDSDDYGRFIAWLADVKQVDITVENEVTMEKVIELVDEWVSGPIYDMNIGSIYEYIVIVYMNKAGFGTINRTYDQNHKLNLIEFLHNIDIVYKAIGDDIREFFNKVLQSKTFSAKNYEAGIIHSHNKRYNKPKLYISCYHSFIETYKSIQPRLSYELYSEMDPYESILMRDRVLPSGIKVEDYTFRVCQGVLRRLFGETDTGLLPMIDMATLFNLTIPKTFSFKLQTKNESEPGLQVMSTSAALSSN